MELVIRVPVFIRPPDDLTRALFVREARENEANSEFTPDELRRLAGDLYTAGTRLFEAIRDDPALLERFVRARAADLVDLDGVLTDEATTDVLTAAVAHLADPADREFFTRPETADGLFLDDRADAALRTVEFGPPTLTFVSAS